jgi:signal transduction histidine kinase
LDCDNDQWSIIIADTGIGISSEAQAQIFESYFRVGTETTYSPNSTGLGLAIVDKLVKLLKGKIDLVSKPKSGSTFTITFPKEITISS